jgi:hypothetical protein
MKGVILPNLRISQSRNSLYRLFLTYLLIPVKSGLFGFAIFFTVLLLVKTFLLLLSNRNMFMVSIEDVALSLIGFASFYMVRIFKDVLGGK